MHKKLKKLGCYYSFCNTKIYFKHNKKCNSETEAVMVCPRTIIIILSSHSREQTAQTTKRHDRRLLLQDDTKKGLRSADSIEYQKDHSESEPVG